MTPPPGPRTAPGRALLEADPQDVYPHDGSDNLTHRILAIEAEAASPNAGLNLRAGTKGFVTVPIEDRFRAKVELGPGCWHWKGGTRSPNPERAYGMIWMDGKHRPASKIAWELYHRQPFPDGMDALHTCDNPACVNPAHIYPGTPSDNAKDMIRKGRGGGQFPPGSNSHE